MFGAISISINSVLMSSSGSVKLHYEKCLLIWGNAKALKEAVADLTLENRLLKKSMIGDGDERG